VGACTVNGIDVSGSFVDNADNTYTVAYTLTEGDSNWTTSSLPISCSLSDSAGNSTTTVAYTDSNTLAGDANTPIITLTAVTPSSGVISYGQAITTTITTGETGLSVGTCTVNGVDVSGSFVDNTDNTYTLVYTFTGGDSDWASGGLPISCELQDAANSTTTVAYTDGNTLAGDGSVPHQPTTTEIHLPEMQTHQ